MAYIKLLLCAKLGQEKVFCHRKKDNDEDITLNRGTGQAQSYFEITMLKSMAY